MFVKRTLHSTNAMIQKVRPTDSGIMSAVVSNSCDYENKSTRMVMIPSPVHDLY